VQSSESAGTKGLRADKGVRERFSQQGDFNYKQDPRRNVILEKKKGRGAGRPAACPNSLAPTFPHGPTEKKGVETGQQLELWGNQKTSGQSGVPPLEIDGLAGNSADIAGTILGRKKGK